MSFLTKFTLRSQPRVWNFFTKTKALNLSTHMSLSDKYKYGKLINDHVTSAFYLPIEDGTDMGVVLYEQQKGILNLHHTEVPENLRGKNIGHDLAKEVFEYCSARNLKVLLTCEFLQKFYKENPQYKDLVVMR